MRRPSWGLSGAEDLDVSPRLGKSMESCHIAPQKRPCIYGLGPQLSRRNHRGGSGRRRKNQFGPGYSKTTVIHDYPGLSGKHSGSGGVSRKTAYAMDRSRGKSREKKGRRSNEATEKKMCLGRKRKSLSVLDEQHNTGGM